MQNLKRCPHCNEVFGTDAALELHQTGTPAKPRCRDKYEMSRRGAWQGLGGVWWTPDRGFPDEAV